MLLFEATCSKNEFIPLSPDSPTAAVPPIFSLFALRGFGSTLETSSSNSSVF